MKKTTIRLFIPLAASMLALAGCGGGGGSSSSATNPAPPVTAESGATLNPVTDPSAGGTATAAFSLAVDINNDGQVIGYAETAVGSAFTAALWTVDAEGTSASAPTPLKPIGSNTFSAGFGIDEAGNVVGQSSSGASLVAVLWNSGVAEPVVLPALAAGNNSNAFGISPDGTKIVGEAVDAAQITRAVVWKADAQGDFTIAPQVLPVNIFAAGGELSSFSSANGVNDDGWIVGIAEDGNGVSHAALWRPNASGIYAATDLRTGGEEGSIAYAVSASGQVVGESEASAGVFVPVLWAEQTENNITEIKRTDLAASGAALAVNDTQRAAGFTGASPMATVWNLQANTAAALFSTASQVYGINDTNLVVGVNDGKGFVTKAN